MKNFVYFQTREEARRYCASEGIVQSKIQKGPAGLYKNCRWFVESQ